MRPSVQKWNGIIHKCLNKRRVGWFSSLGKLGWFYLVFVAFHCCSFTYRRMPEWRFATPPHSQKAFRFILLDLQVLNGFSRYSCHARGRTTTTTVNSPQGADEAIDGAFGVQRHDVPDMEEAGGRVRHPGPVLGSDGHRKRRYTGGGWWVGGTFSRRREAERSHMQPG